MSNQGSLRSRVIGGMLGLGLARLIALLTPLVQLPIFLGVWGIDNYGAWITANALIGFPTIASLSILPAIGAEVAMRHGADERTLAHNAYATGTRAIIVLSLLLYVACVSLFWLIEQHVDWEVGHLGMLTVVLLLTSFCISNFATTYATLLGSIGHYAMGNAIEATRRGVELLIIALGVWVFRFSPVSAASALVVTAACSSFCGWLAFRRYSGLSLYAGRFDWRLLLRLRRSILGSLMLGVSYSQIFVLGPRLLIGYTLGNSAVVNFSVTSNFVRLTRQVADLTTYPFQNELSFAYGRNDSFAVRRLFILSSRLAFWFAIAAAIGVLLLAPWLIKVLSSGALTVDPILLCVLVAALLAECASLGPIIFLISIGATLPSSAILLVSGVVGLILGTLISPSYGVNVFGWVVLAVSILYCISLWAYSLPLAGVRAREFLAAMARPPIAEGIAEAVKLLRRSTRT